MKMNDVERIARIVAGSSDHEENIKKLIRLIKKDKRSKKVVAVKYEK